MRRKMQVLAMALAVCLCAASAGAALQENPQPPAASQQRRERGERGGRVAGTITSVGVDRFEIKRMDGQPFTVFVNDQTRFSRDNQPLALEDLKPGDQVFARGQANSDQQFTASLVREITEQDRERFAGTRAFGEITAIQGNELKISNRRQGERVVTVNDQTRIVKDGQPITLQDLKVGDRIAAFGQETVGKFVAERIMTGHFRRGPRSGSPPQP
jgi:Domain of unknown function (DUF5666)